MLTSNWNSDILKISGAHFLQTSEWAVVKEQTGWKANRLEWRSTNGKLQAAVQVLEREIRLGPLTTSVLYVPRGPMTDWQSDSLTDSILLQLEQLARARKAILIKIDPDITAGAGVPGREDDCENPTGQALMKRLLDRKWRYSPEQIQFKNTVYLDLNGTEEDWLKRMKQKTRYNLRLAMRSGVVVEQAAVEDLPALYAMYAETSVRDGFIIRPQEYYIHVWSTFMQSGLATPLVAKVDGQSVAGLVLFTFGKKAWYVYGMSTQFHREKMPNYLLQWEAMRLAKEKGCTHYDLWGAPDRFEESDSMWGVYRFKEGLGGKVLRGIGAWDYTPYPAVYFLYTRVMPLILDVMRRRGRKRVRREVSL